MEAWKPFTKTTEDAMDIARDYFEEIPLPECNDYVNGSWKLVYDIDQIDFVCSCYNDNQEDGQEDGMSWRIWHCTFNDKGQFTGAGVSCTSYTRKGNAVRAARKRFSNLPDKKFEWGVSVENPWQ